ncbi:hypothetical protein GCM10022419_056280 [Nonomuraea rosea]|uniref:Calcium-binding protein n=1 Tax=Nonomuraea rosea TaxID=638574 RepID=A0ABP6XKF8_9ACTN
MRLRQASIALLIAPMIAAAVAPAAQAAAGDSQPCGKPYRHVNEVYFRGGGNDQPDGGLRECRGPGRPLPV